MTLKVASREDVVTVPNAAVVDVRQARATALALGVEAPAFGPGGRAAGAPAERGAQERRPGGGERAGAGGGHPGVVFLQGPGGIEARRVSLGLTDWEYTEVVDGLEAGDQVVLVSVAELQRQQQEMTDRVRQRFGGPMGSGSGQGAGRRATGGRN